MASLKLVLVVVCVLLAAQLAVGRVLYTRTHVPTGWRLESVAKPESKLSFVLGLKQRNLDVLDRVFKHVSTPGSKSYRHFLTNEEILDIIKPSQNDVNAVINWLRKAHIPASNIKVLGDAIEVHTTVRTAARLFKTQFHNFHNQKTSARVVRSMGAYSVPQRLSKIIELVEGISSFPVPHYKAHTLRNHHHTKKHHNVTKQDLTDGIVAESLFSLYNIRKEQYQSATKTSQGVIEFQGQNFNPDDLQSYAAQVGIKIAAVDSSRVIGPNDPTAPGTEASLDIDLIASVNDEATNWFWIEDSTAWLYTWAVHFFGTPDVPQVVSISYGWYEADQCSIDPDECSSIGVDPLGYVARVNTEFQKIGLRGTSILASSGDSGANGRTDGDCTIPQLRAAFPASSPFVTAVGATELVNAQYNLQNPPPVCTSGGYQCPSSGTEQAVSFAISGFASGGGFSNISATPDWQQAAVQKYLQTSQDLPPASYYNAQGRGIPDVAAIGHNTLIYQGYIQAVGGTSASSPIFASVVALLNQASIGQTGKPLGFLNPLLYSIWAQDPTSFNDVTVGDNKCTENGCNPDCQGFSADAGWDPVTGLGTPNFAKLLTHILTL